MPPCVQGVERSPVSGLTRFGLAGSAREEFDAAELLTTALGRPNCACDKASPAAAVMLHLRSRYVSKAAILTVPALPAPVENRSPA